MKEGVWVLPLSSVGEVGLANGSGVPCQKRSCCASLNESGVPGQKRCCCASLNEKAT